MTTNFLIRIVCLGLMVGALAGRQVEAAPATFYNKVMVDGPLAYWRLGEAPGATTAADASGHGLVGTYSTAGIALGQAGLGGGDTAALFDGSEGVVEVPHNALFNVTQITIESIIRWAGPIGLQQRIIEKSTEPGATRPVFSLQVLDDARLQVELGFLGITGEKVVLDSVGLIPVGTPAHVAATFDGSAIRLYINGQPDASVDFAGSLRTDTDRPLGLGNQAERERPFNGLIDEAVLYDYALSGDRLAEHWQAVPEPGAVVLLAGGLPVVAVLAGGRRRRRRPAA